MRRSRSSGPSAREEARPRRRKQAEPRKREEATQGARPSARRSASAERLADEQAEKKKLAEKASKDEARQAAIREANLRRMMSQAGASDDPRPPAPPRAPRVRRRATPAGSRRGSSRTSSSPATVPGNPLATVEVRLAPDGTIVGRKLTTSSGSPAWDETVLRAIDKTEVLPSDIDGRVPSSMSIDFRPQE